MRGLVLSPHMQGQMRWRGRGGVGCDRTTSPLPAGHGVGTPRRGRRREGGAPPSSSRDDLESRWPDTRGANAPTICPGLRVSYAGRVRYRGTDLTSLRFDVLVSTLHDVIGQKRFDRYLGTSCRRAGRGGRGGCADRLPGRDSGWRGVRRRRRSRSGGWGVGHARIAAHRATVTPCHGRSADDAHEPGRPRPADASAAGAVRGCRASTRTGLRVVGLVSAGGVRGRAAWGRVDHAAGFPRAESVPKYRSIGHCPMTL